MRVLRTLYFSYFQKKSTLKLNYTETTIKRFEINENKKWRWKVWLSTQRYVQYLSLSLSLSLHKFTYSHHDTWLAVAASPYVLFHHRALTSPVIRFVTITLLSLPDAMPNKSDNSQPKWVCVHAKHVLSAIFTFSCVFSTIAPSVCPPASLSFWASFFLLFTVTLKCKKHQQFWKHNSKR